MEKIHKTKANFNRIHLKFNLDKVNFNQLIL
jgi:hypothetical protein